MPQRTTEERLAIIETILARMEVELTEDIRQLRQMVERRLEEHDQRISALERWRLYLLGIWVAVATMAGLVWDWARDRFRL